MVEDRFCRQKTFAILSLEEGIEDTIRPPPPVQQLAANTTEREAETETETVQETIQQILSNRNIPTCIYFMYLFAPLLFILCSSLLGGNQGLEKGVGC